MRCVVMSHARLAAVQIPQKAQRSPEHCWMRSLAGRYSPLPPPTMPASRTWL